MIVSDEGKIKIEMTPEEFAVFGMAILQTNRNREQRRKAYDHARMTETRIWDSLEDNVSGVDQAIELLASLENDIFDYLFKADEAAIKELRKENAMLDPQFERVSQRGEELCFAVYSGDVGDDADEQMIEEFRRMAQRLKDEEVTVELNHWSHYHQAYTHAAIGIVDNWRTQYHPNENTVNCWVSMRAGTIVKRLDIEPTGTTEAMRLDLEIEDEDEP